MIFISIDPKEKLKRIRERIKRITEEVDKAFNQMPPEEKEEILKRLEAEEQARKHLSPKGRELNRLIKSLNFDLEMLEAHEKEGNKESAALTRKCIELELQTIRDYYLGD